MFQIVTIPYRNVDPESWDDQIVGKPSIIVIVIIITFKILQVSYCEYWVMTPMTYKHGNGRIFNILNKG